MSTNWSANRNNEQQSYNRGNNSNWFGRNQRYNDSPRDTGQNFANNSRFERPRENNFFANRDRNNDTHPNNFNNWNNRNDTDRSGFRNNNPNNNGYNNFNGNANNRYNQNNNARNFNNNARFNNQNSNGINSNLPSSFVCYYCNKRGHAKRNCFKWIKDTQEGNVPSGNDHGNPRTGGEAAAPSTRPTPVTQVASSSSTRQP